MKFTGLDTGGGSIDTGESLIVVALLFGLLLWWIFKKE